MNIYNIHVHILFIKNTLYNCVHFNTACVVIMVTHNTLLDLLKTGPFDFGPFDIGSFDIHIIYHIIYKYPSHIILMALLIISISMAFFNYSNN